MKKQLLKINFALLCFSLLNFSTAFSQDARTMLQFEDAEKAFNAGNYTETIKQLDEVEKTTGVTSKTLYLRIVSENNLLGGREAILEDKKQFEKLKNLRSLTTKYLKALADQEIDEKYRKVYEISEKLNDFPKNEQEWQKEKTAREEKLKQAKEAEEKNLYDKVAREKSVAVAKEYMNKYPNGKYKNEVNKMYADALYREAEESLKKGNYTVAKSQFNIYKTQFPNGEKTNIINAKLKEADKGIETQNAMRKHARINTYVLASYATDGNIGVEIGGMSMDTRVKMLLTLEGKAPFPIINEDEEDDKIPNDTYLPFNKSGDMEDIYFTSTLGINVRIKYPVWAYGAVGIRIRRARITKQGMETFGMDERKVYKIEGRAHSQIFPEIGVGYRALNIIVVKAGVRVIDGDPILKIGAGICF